MRDRGGSSDPAGRVARRHRRATRTRPSRQPRRSLQPSRPHRRLRPGASGRPPALWRRLDDSRAVAPLGATDEITPRRDDSPLDSTQAKRALSHPVWHAIATTWLVAHAMRESGPRQLASTRTLLLPWMRNSIEYGAGVRHHPLAEPQRAQRSGVHETGGTPVIADRKDQALAHFPPATSTPTQPGPSWPRSRTTCSDGPSCSGCPTPPRALRARCAGGCLSSPAV